MKGVRTGSTLAGTVFKSYFNIKCSIDESHTVVFVCLAWIVRTHWSNGGIDMNHVRTTDVQAKPTNAPSTANIYISDNNMLLMCLRVMMSFVMIACDFSCEQQMHYNKNLSIYYAASQIRNNDFCHILNTHTVVMFIELLGRNFRHYTIGYRFCPQ